MLIGLKRAMIAAVVLLLGCLGLIVWTRVGWGIDLTSARVLAALGRRLATAQPWPDGLPTAFIGAGVATGTLGMLAQLLVRPGADYGAAAWARQGEAADAGLNAKAGFVFGWVRGRIAFTRRLLCVWTLSALVMGPSRTGKSAGVIIPSILALPKTASAFIHDVKGELAQATAGWRAKCGAVHVFNLAKGPRASACWNPLAASELPDDSASVGDMIDIYWSILLPETGSGNRFFDDSGRMAGAAVTLYLVCRAGAAKKDATFFQVLEFVSALRVETEEAEDADGFVDVVRENLERCAQEAGKEGWPQRIAVGLRQLGQLDGRTRSGVIGTMFAALSRFLNENVAACTAQCTMSVRDYGRKDKPITVYWVSPPLDAPLYGIVAGMHLEVATRWLTGAFAREGREVAYVLDEAAFLPKMSVIQKGPAILLGFGIHIMVAVQDIAQLLLVYGREATNAMLTNFGHRVIFAQNNYETAKAVCDSIGDRTRVVDSLSGRTLSPDESASLRAEGVKLLRPQDLMSLPFGEVIVLTQYRTQRPFRAKSAYFKKVRRWRRASALPLPASAARALG